MKPVIVALFCSLLFVMPNANAQSNQSTLVTRINWPQFMARHDLTWNEIPTRWESGAFIGNGVVGAMIYSGEFEGKRDVLRWDINRSDVTDKGNRLPIGQMVLQPVGKVLSSDEETMRLDLWNAEVRGIIKTDKGTIVWRSFTHATEPVIVIETHTSGEESGAKFEWRALPAEDPRKVHNKEPIPESEKNPPPIRDNDRSEIQVSTQQLHNDWEYAVAWRREPIGANHKVLGLSIAPHQWLPEHNKIAFDEPGARRDAVRDVNHVVLVPLQHVVEEHRAWWHQFYPKSFVSLPDSRLESFYWIQMYKLGSAMRADGPMLDLMGPWFRSTPWPKIWWNLNVQLTYWPLIASNHLDLHDSLNDTLFRNQQNLINNVREEWRSDAAFMGRTSSYDLKSGEWKELGNLTWALHNVWMSYRATMDDAMLRDKLYPLLKRSIGYYLHRLETDADGKLHLPVAISPEYPTEAADTNYDLSLLRWGLTALIASSERLKLNDPLVPKWKETLQNLTPYPTDEKTGLMIGRAVPLSQSHRHFSHMLMVYPLHLMTPSRDRALIEKSLDHWIGSEGALQGYSFTGTSSMSSLLGRRDDAVRLLNEFLDRYVKPNTMYLESGPVIETPLAGAQSIHDLLLQSWGETPFQETIHVFPGVPAAWRDVTFHNLRAPGGFLVSAARKNGLTQWIRITSLAGEPCRVQDETVGFPQNFGILKSGAKVLTGGVLQLDIKKGQSVLLLRQGVRERDAVVAPVTAQNARLNYWGSKKIIPITPDASGAFDLPAAAAQIHGDKLFFQKSGSIGNLGRWIETGDWANWKIQIKKPGRYKVLCTYASPGGGSAFAVGIGARRIEATVLGTGSFDAFKEFPIGEIALDKVGKTDVEVRAVEIKGALFNLARVRLVPSP